MMCIPDWVYIVRVIRPCRKSHNSSKFIDVCDRFGSTINFYVSDTRTVCGVRDLCECVPDRCACRLVWLIDRSIVHTNLQNIA